MEARAYVFIFGWLAICVSLVVAGSLLPHTWYSALMLIVGIVGGIVWFIGLFYLANAMNSDI